MRFSFWLDPFFQKDISHESVQITNHFHLFAPRVRIFQSRLHNDRFRQTYFIQLVLIVVNLYSCVWYTCNPYGSVGCAPNAWCFTCIAHLQHHMNFHALRITSILHRGVKLCCTIDHNCNAVRCTCS